MKTLLKSLALPLAMVLLFLVGTLYEQEIVVRLGVETIAQLRNVFPYLLHTGIWLSFAYLVNRVIGILVWDPLNRRVPVPRLLRDVTALLVYALAVTGIVGVVFDKPIGPFWAASGAAGIVIGLALRNVIVDIFIGLAVNFDRPFEIGHFVQLQNGPAGRVVELNWRTTRLLTAEGNLVIIPNGKLGDMIVTNFSRPEAIGEFEFVVCLDFGVPAERALRVLNAAARGVAGSTGILEEPRPVARIRGFVAQGVEYKIKYTLDPRKAGPGKARHEMMRAVLDQLHRAGLQLATPKQDVFHAEMPRRHFDARSLEDRIALIYRVEIFRGLSVDERTILANHMKERLFKEGETIIRNGEAGDSMFVLFEGLLDVMIALKPGEPESRVARLKGGMFFGEMSALTGEPRSATVVAATDSVTFEITKADLSGLLQNRPEIAEIIGGVVAARKFRNTEARSLAGAQERDKDERSFAAQIIGKIAAFFSLGQKKPA